MGHVGPLVVGDLGEAIAFYRQLGLRPGFHHHDMASMEMRGGTHLVLVRGEEEPSTREAPFHLMVGDLSGHRATLVAAGIDASPIEVAGAHHRF